MTRCSDKYTVREYVKSKGYGMYLNELYAVYDSADDIDFDRLPDSFAWNVLLAAVWIILLLIKEKKT